MTGRKNHTNQCAHFAASSLISPDPFSRLQSLTAVPSQENQVEVGKLRVTTTEEERHARQVEERSCSPREGTIFEHAQVEKFFGPKCVGSRLISASKIEALKAAVTLTTITTKKILASAEIAFAPQALIKCHLQNAGTVHQRM